MQEKREAADEDGTKSKSKWNDVFSRLFPKRPPIVKQQSQERSREWDESTATGEDEDEFGNPLDKDTVLVVGDLWVGDPKAIGSVRRARRSPEELTNRENSIGEVRKLIRDMPQYPLCSRNCNRPGAALESIASSMPVYNLPALAKAQLKRTKSISVDVLTLDDDIRDVDKLPIIDVNYAHEKGQELIKKSKEKQRELLSTTRMLYQKMQKVRGGAGLQETTHVVQEGTHGARIQICYTLPSSTKLRQGVMKS